VRKVVEYLRVSGRFDEPHTSSYTSTARVPSELDSQPLGSLPYHSPPQRPNLKDLACADTLRQDSEELRLHWRDRDVRHARIPGPLMRARQGRVAGPLSRRGKLALEVGVHLCRRVS